MNFKIECRAPYYLLTLLFVFYFFIFFIFFSCVQARTGNEMGAANFARRSPWPMINILRTPQVKAAQRGVPTGQVYKQNEERLSAVGTTTLEVRYALTFVHFLFLCNIYSICIISFVNRSFLLINFLILILIQFGCLVLSCLFISSCFISFYITLFYLH